MKHKKGIIMCSNHDLIGYLKVTRKYYILRSSLPNISKYVYCKHISDTINDIRSGGRRARRVACNLVFSLTGGMFDPKV